MTNSKPPVAMNKPPARKHENKSLMQRSTFRYWSNEHVRVSDTDMQGHVNNTAFAVYAETGRNNFVWDLLEIISAEQKALFVLAKLTLNYLGELHWPAKVGIGTGVVSIGTSSCVFGQGLFVDERCVATAESVFVCIDDISHASRPIPDSLKQHLTAFEIAVVQ